jgi:hypothetical protein
MLNLVLRALGQRLTADRILAIVPPISAFVAAGIEHSVALTSAVSILELPVATLIDCGGSRGGGRQRRRPWSSCCSA